MSVSDRPIAPVPINRRISGRVFKTAMSLLFFVTVGCQSSQEKAQQQRKAEQERQTISDVSYLYTHYNAVVDWPQKLQDKVFSIDAEAIFLRSDGHPILFYGSLEDIRRDQDKILLFFRSTPTEDEPTLQLILDCSGCDLKLLKSSAESFGDFAVVAEVTSAAKPLDDDAKDVPDFVLHGKFVDARYVGNYALRKHLADKQP